ncbi:MAG: hypothetical protein IJ087_20705 [Eggerthellaceae bacterium]|nr:hypothetical protein [Eggerthellaceae bacterium]
MTEQPCRLDIRISPQDKLLLKRRCDEFGMTQTDYMRMLINLPLRMVDEGMEEQSDLFVIDRWGASKISAQIRRLGYLYNQSTHALNSIAYYLRRDEADSLDALDALENATEKLEAVDTGVQAICKQLNSLVGKRFGYELFESNRYQDSHDMQGRKRQNKDTEASL